MMMSPLQSPAAARARAQRQPRTPNNKRMPSSLLDLKRESNSRKYDIGALATPARRAPLARSNTIDAVPSFCTPQRNATDTRRRNSTTSGVPLVMPGNLDDSSASNVQQEPESPMRRTYSADSLVTPSRKNRTLFRSNSSTDSVVLPSFCTPSRQRNFTDDGTTTNRNSKSRAASMVMPANLDGDDDDDASSNGRDEEEDRRLWTALAPATPRRRPSVSAKGQPQSARVARRGSTSMHGASMHGTTSNHEGRRRQHTEKPSPRRPSLLVAQSNHERRRRQDSAAADKVSRPSLADRRAVSHRQSTAGKGVPEDMDSSWLENVSIDTDSKNLGACDKNRRRQSTTGAVPHGTTLPRRSFSNKSPKKQQEECDNIHDRTPHRKSTTGAVPQGTTLPRRSFSNKSPKKQQEECDNIDDKARRRKSSTGGVSQDPITPRHAVSSKSLKKQQEECANMDKKSRRRKSTSGAGALQDPITPRRSASSKNLKKQQEECANIDDKSRRRKSTSGTLQDPITPGRSVSSKSPKKQQEECANIDDDNRRRRSTIRRCCSFDSIIKSPKESGREGRSTAHQSTTPKKKSTTSEQLGNKVPVMPDRRPRISNHKKTTAQDKHQVGLSQSEHRGVRRRPSSHNKKSKSNDCSAFCTPRRKGSGRTLDLHMDQQASMSSITMAFDDISIDYCYVFSSSSDRQDNKPKVANKPTKSTTDTPESKKSKELSVKVDLIRRKRLAAAQQKAQEQMQSAADKKPAKLERAPSSSKQQQRPAEPMPPVAEVAVACPEESYKALKMDDDAVLAIAIVAQDVNKEDSTLSAAGSNHSTHSIRSTFSRREAASTWVCLCDYVSDKRKPFCGMCGTKQTWTCRECQSGDNLCLYAFCAMCGVSKQQASNKSSGNPQENSCGGVPANKQQRGDTPGSPSSVRNSFHTQQV